MRYWSYPLKFVFVARDNQNQKLVLLIFEGSLFLSSIANPVCKTNYLGLI